VTVRILTGDCLASMATLPAESFDLVIADPPYGDTSLAWDSGEPEGWREAARRVLKRTGSMWVFASMRMILANAAWPGWKFAQDVVWEKQNGSGFAADRFRRVHEHVLQFYRDDAPWGGVWNVPQMTHDAVARKVGRSNKPPHTGDIGPSSYEPKDGDPRLMRSVLQVRSMHYEAVHPTQKPEELVRILVETSCPPGGAIFDPFAGSGTTGLVAQRLNRNAVLCELNPEYVKIAEARIRGDSPLFSEIK
jgi:site-specific DNA-methyltransferase (adenine-specific)